jgi:hypothetical protein
MPNITSTAFSYRGNRVAGHATLFNQSNFGEQFFYRICSYGIEYNLQSTEVIINTEILKEQVILYTW